MFGATEGQILIDSLPTPEGGLSHPRLLGEGSWFSSPSTAHAALVCLGRQKKNRWVGNL